MPRAAIIFLAFLCCLSFFWVQENIKPETKQYVILSMTYHPNACGCKKYDIVVRELGSTRTEHMYVEKALYDSKSVKDIIIKHCDCNVYSAFFVCYLVWKGISYITLFHFRQHRRWTHAHRIP